MKTKTNLLVKILFLTALVVFQLKCGSSSGTTTAAVSYYTSNGVCYSSAGSVVSSTYCSSTGYYLSNGSCYSSAGTLVATTYCTSTTTTGYTYSNGVCYSTSTGTVVATTYCTTSMTSTAQSCSGSYYWCPYGISSGLISCQLGYCYVTNCRGYTLYTSAGTAVLCE